MKLHQDTFRPDLVSEILFHDEPGLNFNPCNINYGWCSDHDLVNVISYYLFLLPIY
jgi:hypothetical protein